MIVDLHHDEVGQQVHITLRDCIASITLTQKNNTLSVMTKLPVLYVCLVVTKIVNA